MNISTTALGDVEIVRRVDGDWSKWTGEGNAEGLEVGDAVDLAGIPEELGKMTLSEYCQKRTNGTL